MKIAVVTASVLKTPPKNYGGAEMICFDLCEALAAGGDDVTLIAPAGSYAKGCKVFQTIISPEKVNVNWVELEKVSYDVYKKELDNFDIIHDHSWFYFSILAKLQNKNIKTIKTHHGHLSWDPTKIPEQLKPINLVAISNFMRREYVAQGLTSKFVYNGIDISAYPYVNKPHDSGLIFVGRLSKFKDPIGAIRAAIETNNHIDVVGASFTDDVNYLNDVKRMCENSNGLATLHLDASHEEKVRLLQNAKACLIFSAFGEPFCLVSPESMAVGTPVIAYNDGALREVVGADGVAGYVCNTYEEAMARIRSLDDTPLKSSDCRARAEIFSRENMAKNYRKLYKEVIEGGGW